MRPASVALSGVVLSHADADHRGGAPALGAPVYCHPAERAAAESPDPWRDYWDLEKLDPHGRVLLRRLLPSWDGGAVDRAGHGHRWQTRSPAFAWSICPDTRPG